MSLIGDKVTTPALLQTVSLGADMAAGGGGVLVPRDEEQAGSKAAGLGYLRSALQQPGL